MFNFLRKLFGLTRLPDTQKVRDAAQREQMQRAVNEYQSESIFLVNRSRNTRKLQTRSEMDLRPLRPKLH